MSVFIKNNNRKKLKPLSYVTNNISFLIIFFYYRGLCT